MDIEMNELRRYRDEINLRRKQAIWTPPNEDECVITYMRMPPGSLGFGFCEGIPFSYHRQKHKSKERPKLRKGTMNYLRLVRRNGNLLRVDKYVNGRIDVVHLAQYFDGVRYLFPFMDGGGFYPTYTYVTYWENDQPSMELWVEGGQILRWTYDYREDKTIVASYINAVPDGTVPILSRGSHVFIPGDEITML